MTDKRLRDYLFENEYIIDCTEGWIGGFPRKLCPFLINGKSPTGDIIIGGEIRYEGMSLEEFIEWERSLHRMEGEGSLDQGEGRDGGHGDILGGEGRIERGEPDLVSLVRLLDVLNGRVGVPVGDERKQVDLSPEDAVD